PGTDATVRDLRNLLALGGRHSKPGSWRPRIVNTVATTAAGIADLMTAFDAHRDWLKCSGAWPTRRVGRFAMQLETIVLAQLRQRLLGLSDPDRPADSGGMAADTGGLLCRLAQQVRRGERDVYDAAKAIRAELIRAAADNA
ncbi:MAG: hypothetical protein ACRDQZ_22980, partial [Mycobacteriales bacterium]